MSKKIKMLKWHNGGGVNLTFEPEYGGPIDRLSLDFTDVDRLMALLQDYREHPSPYRIVRTEPR